MVLLQKYVSVSTAMKIAAAKAIASLINDKELEPENIIPAPFDLRVGKAVADAVAKAARESKMSRI
jgi:malate dehydrogenase (oxaloacetate-decarboxylating)